MHSLGIKTNNDTNNFMTKLFDEIKDKETYIKDDGLMIKVNNKYGAWDLKNRIEKTGYKVDMEQNGDGHYIVKVWGVQLMDLYLNEKYAI